jgi:alpha-L-fucosidase
MKCDSSTFCNQFGAMRRVALWSFFCAMAVMCLTSPAKAADRKHTADMTWWKHDRFGMFIHWGLYSQAAGYWHGKPEKGAGEWLMNNMHLTRAQYATLAPKFDPVKFNADKWVSIAKAAGMKYIVITTKHHDGFCMFRTKATKYNVVDDTPWHTDPMALLAAACKRQGIRFCTYYSIQDWHSRYTLPHSITNGRPNWQGMRFVAPDGGKEYVHYMERQVRELITQYHPGIIWFDNNGSTPWTTANGVHVAGWTRADAADVFHFVRKLDPTVIINNRLGYGFGDYSTPEQRIPPGGIPGNWETCMTINNTWGYKRQDKNFKSVATLLTNLIKCASGGGNYLLNVGPTGAGVIPKPEVTRLMAMGRWLKVNGAAIYGSHRTPFKKAMPWGYITSKPGRLYLEVLHWQKTISVPMSNTLTKAYLLANGAPVTTDHSGQGITIMLPKAAPDRIAGVVVLEFNGAVKPL